MALKDWKKTGENDWMGVKKEVFLRIEKIKWNSYYSTHWFKKEDKYMVVFTGMHWPMSVHKRIGFKTKIQALKYAKAYMRKH